MIASCYPFFIKNKKILLARRRNTGYADGMYSLPAGHVEEDESLTDSLCREVREEVGLSLKPSSLTLVHVMHRKEFDIRMDFFFHVSSWNGTPSICEPEKCDDLRWFPLSQLPRDTVLYIRAAIEAYQKGVFFSERGW